MLIYNVPPRKPCTLNYLPSKAYQVKYIFVECYCLNLTRKGANFEHSCSVFIFLKAPSGKHGMALKQKHGMALK